MSALHCDWCTCAVHCWKAWFQGTCISIEVSIVCLLENFGSGKRKYCLRKSPEKASNFPPSNTLFEPYSSCGCYFCFSRVSAEESINCNLLERFRWRLRQTVNVRFKLTISQIWKWEGKNCPKSFLLMNLSGIKLLILESFRSEDENECLSIIHGASTRFNLKFLRVFLKKKTLRKASIYFFHQKSQYGYLYWRKLSPLPIAKW